MAANYNNADFVSAQTDSLKERIAAMRPGLDNTALYANIDRTTVGNRIGAYLAGNNVGAAKALFATQGALLGGQADEYMARIRRAEDSLISRANIARREKILDINDALPDADFLAKQTGDVTQLRALATDMQKLGNARGAEKITRHADMYEANGAALKEANAMPLPQAVQNVADLDAKLEKTTDPHEYRALAAQRVVLAKNFEARVKVFRDDPARAVDTGGEYQNRELQAQDRLTAQAENGLPLDGRKVLTNAEATRLQQLFQSGDKAQALVAVQELTKYGQYAGRAGVQIGLSPAETAVINQARQDPSAIANLPTVMAAASAKTGDLPKREDSAANIKATQQKSQYIGVYNDVVQLMPGNTHALKALQDLQNTTGNLYLMHNDSEKAAQVLDGKMVGLMGDNFALLYNGSLLNRRDIELGLRTALADPLKDFASNMRFANDNVKKDWLYHMNKRGKWINANDNNGFVLIDPVSQAPVMNNQGRTFRITEEQMQELATNARTDERAAHINSTLAF